MGALPLVRTEKINKLADLLELWQGCTKCPLATLRTQTVFGYGNPEARMVMIGEAPGEQDDIVGKPFVGPAGDKFNELLELVGIDRKDIWVTNTCMCRPKSNKLGKKNRAPTVEETNACFPRLVAELNIIQPEIIVLAGNTPLYLATRRRGITKNRGWQQAKWTGDDFVVNHIYATLHPASLLYGSKEQKELKMGWMVEDWQNLARTLSAEKKGD